jgi:hypothetical protein
MAIGAREKLRLDASLSAVRTGRSTVDDQGLSPCHGIAGGSVGLEYVPCRLPPEVDTYLLERSRRIP